MRSVQNLVSKAPSKERTVPSVLGKGTTQAKRALESSVPAEAKTGTTLPTASRDAGIRAILAPAIASGEGCRVLLYGRTRYGKSTFARHLVDAALDARVADTALIHDVKYPDKQQYEGQAVSSITEIGVALKGSSIVVCRPPFPAEDAATAVRLLAEAGERSLLLIDETRRALSGQQRWIDVDGPDGVGRGPKNFEWLSLEGGGVGGSVILLVQRPRQLPGDATDSAQVHVCFGVGGKSLAYLVAAGTVPSEAADTVKRLAPGAFCIFADDEDWNQQIYYSPE